MVLTGCTIVSSSFSDLSIYQKLVFVCLFACLLVCLLTSLLACWLASLLVCWLACLFASFLACLLACWLAGLLACRLAGLPACWLAACLLACLLPSLLACWLACWLACLFSFNHVNQLFHTDETRRRAREPRVLLFMSRLGQYIARVSRTKPSSHLDFQAGPKENKKEHTFEKRRSFAPGHSQCCSVHVVVCSIFCFVFVLFVLFVLFCFVFPEPAKHFQSALSIC